MLGQFSQTGHQAIRLNQADEFVLGLGVRVTRPYFFSSICGSMGEKFLELKAMNVTDNFGRTRFKLFFPFGKRAVLLKWPSNYLQFSRFGLIDGKLTGLQLELTDVLSVDFGYSLKFVQVHRTFLFYGHLAMECKAIFIYQKTRFLD